MRPKLLVTQNALLSGTPLCQTKAAENVFREHKNALLSGTQLCQGKAAENVLRELSA